MSHFTYRDILNHVHTGCLHLNTGMNTTVLASNAKVSIISHYWFVVSELLSPLLSGLRLSASVCSLGGGSAEGDAHLQWLPGSRVQRCTAGDRMQLPPQPAEAALL